VASIRDSLIRTGALSVLLSVLLATVAGAARADLVVAPDPAGLQVSARVMCSRGVVEDSDVSGSGARAATLPLGTACGASVEGNMMLIVESDLVRIGLRSAGDQNTAGVPSAVSAGSARFYVALTAEHDVTLWLFGLSDNQFYSMDASLTAADSGIEVLSASLSSVSPPEVGESRTLPPGTYVYQVAATTIGFYPPGMQGSLLVSTLQIDAPDLDGDSVVDRLDNCPEIANPGQEVNTQRTSQTPGPHGIPRACLCGDVNRDCKINASDSLEIVRHAGFSPPAGSFDSLYCDVDRNGSCDTRDALALVEWSGFTAPQGAVHFGEPYLCQ